MPIDFPTSPVTNQQYTYAGKTYVFSAQGTWVPTGGGAYTASSTAPTSPTPGDHWYDLSTGVLSIYVNDGTSSQWVMVSPSGGSGSVGSPQGRLTLQSLTPVMTTTQSAKTAIYYTPYVGNQIPIYDGSSMVMTTFAELSVATTDTTKSPAAIGVSKVNDWFVWNDGGTIWLGHGPDWTSDTARSAGTALIMVNGILLNNAAITNGPAASRGTYVGTTRSNASSQLDWIFGAAAATGIAGWFGLWNCYNRVAVCSTTAETTSSWTWGTANTWRAPNNSGNMRASLVLGLNEEPVRAIYDGQVVAGSGAGATTGVGLDTMTAASGLRPSANNPTANQQLVAIYDGFIGIGFHYLSALERNFTTTASTWIGNSAALDVQTGLTVEFWS